MKMEPGSGECAVCGGKVRRRGGRLPLVHTGCAEQGYTWHHYGFEVWGGDGPILKNVMPVCYLCGDAPTEHGEHVVPRARGGANEWSNTAGACARCNSSKGARIMDFSADQQERLASQQAAIRSAYDRAVAIPDAVLLADACIGAASEGITVTIGETPDEWLDDDLDPEMTDGPEPEAAHRSIIEMLDRLCAWEGNAMMQTGTIPPVRNLRSLLLGTGPLVAEGEGLNGLVFPAAVDIAIEETIGDDPDYFGESGEEARWFCEALAEG